MGRQGAHRDSAACAVRRAACDQPAISSSNGTALSVDLGLAEHEVGDVVLDHDRLDLGHALAVAAGTSAPPRPASRSSAPAPRCAPAAARAWPAGCWLRTSSATTRPEAHAALGLRLEHLGRDRRLVGVLDAALLQVGARRLRSCARSRLRRSDFGRSSSAALTSASITACLVARQHAELDLALEVLADVGAQRLDACRRRCRATWRRPRRPPAGAGASIFFTVTMKSASLPATSLPW